MNEPGWYVFQLGVPGDSANIGLETPCNDIAERFFVQAQPTLSTTVSSDSVTPGTPIFDRVEVGSLAGTGVTAAVDLFGPFARPRADRVRRRARLERRGDRQRQRHVQDGTFTPTVPGVYAYRAQIESTQLVRGIAGDLRRGHRDDGRVRRPRR